MRRLAALVAAIALAGCCNCSDTHVPEHAQRPGDVVRDLRDAIGDRKWDEAALCFSIDIRQKNAAEMASGRFFEGSYPGDRKIGSFVPIPWPLGPRDTLEGVSIDKDEAIATIDHVGPFADEHDRRPRQLVLKKNEQGRWEITGWHD